jgi:hypothetical protein
MDDKEGGARRPQEPRHYRPSWRTQDVEANAGARRWNYRHAHAFVDKPGVTVFAGMHAPAATASGDVAGPAVLAPWPFRLRAADTHAPEGSDTRDPLIH